MEIMVFFCIFGLFLGCKSFLYTNSISVFSTGDNPHNTCLWRASISRYVRGNIWPCTGYILWCVCVCMLLLFKVFMSQDKCVLFCKSMPAEMCYLCIRHATIALGAKAAVTALFFKIKVWAARFVCVCVLFSWQHHSLCVFICK